MAMFDRLFDASKKLPRLQKHMLLICLSFITQAALAQSKYLPDEPNKQESASYCKRENFEQFLDIFAEDLDFQNSHTAYPLKYTLNDSSDITDPYIVKYLSKPQYLARKFRYPNKEQREEGNTSYKISKPKKNSREVLLFKEDTDIATSFFFTWNHCWRLTAVHAY